MMFRNSYRLLLANFSCFWKDFLYKAIAVLITVLLLSPVMLIVSNLNGFSVLISDAESLFVTFAYANMPVFLNSLFEVINLVFVVFANLFSANFFAGVYICLILFVVFPFLFSWSELAVSEVIYGFMASQTKYGFTASFIKKIGKASVYTIFKVLFSLPFFFASFFGAYGILALGYYNLVSMLFIPTLVVLFVVCLYGFKITLFSGWAPAIIVFNTGAFKAIGNGLKALFRRFFKTYSSLCMILILNILLAGLFGVVSLGLLIPLAMLNLAIFQMVMLFGSQGMRYYVDTDTILSPKKLEETDKIKRAKNII